MYFCGARHVLALMCLWQIQTNSTSIVKAEQWDDLDPRFFAAESRPHNEQGWSSQSSHNALISNEGLLQGIASCIGKLVIQDGCQDPPEADAAGRSMAPTQLPTYLQDITW